MAVDDANTKVLLHFNGANNSTTFTDESGKVWTARGNAKISTAQSVFGGAAYLGDGTGDYIDTPDHADFNLTSVSEWTFDWRMRFASLPTDGNKFVVFSQGDDLSNFAVIEVFNLSGTYALVWEIVNAGNSVVEYGVVSAVTNTWSHMAVVKTSANNYMFYQDGARVANNNNTSYQYKDFAASPRIGAHIDNGYSHNGYLDEFRLSHAARWTGATYTVPTAEYAPAGSGSLLFDDRRQRFQNLIVR